MEEQNLQLSKTPNQIKLWEKLKPVNRIAASDTYKRTMSGSSEIFSDNFSCYNLAARKSLNEAGINGRLIMAGVEKMLYPWFKDRITQEEFDEAKQFFSKQSSVKKFPEKAWNSVLENDGYMPLDIWGLPGGQTILVKDGKHVPLLSVEGKGAIVSHLEPHLENIYAPIIQATKARLFNEIVKDNLVEFGLRADQLENNHVTLMHALYVGGGVRYTSDDQAVLLFPELFKDIGTEGHEFIMAYQKEGRTLEEAQELSNNDFVNANERSALLPDIISTVKSGLPAILRQVMANPKKLIMPRFDSGDIVNQCITWKKMTLEKRLQRTMMVLEDGMTPSKTYEIFQAYARAGYNPNNLNSHSKYLPDTMIVGAGGYFAKDNHRDAISLAYKRSATMHDGKLESSLKFSDSPGKESIPGRIRVYENGSTLIVAQEGEEVEGIPLYKQLVKNGRIVYNESLDDQHERAKCTWNKYDAIEYSPKTQKLIDDRLAEKNSLEIEVEVTR